MIDFLVTWVARLHGLCFFLPPGFGNVRGLQISADTALVVRYRNLRCGGRAASLFRVMHLEDRLGEAGEFLYAHKVWGSLAKYPSLFIFFVDCLFLTPLP